MTRDEIEAFLSKFPTPHKSVGRTQKLVMIKEIKGDLVPIYVKVEEQIEELKSQNKWVFHYMGKEVILNGDDIIYLK